MSKKQLFFSWYIYELKQKIFVFSWKSKVTGILWLKCEVIYELKHYIITYVDYVRTQGLMDSGTKELNVEER